MALAAAALTRMPSRSALVTHTATGLCPGCARRWVRHWDPLHVCGEVWRGACDRHRRVRCDRACQAHCPRQQARRYAMPPERLQRHACARCMVGSLLDICACTPFWPARRCGTRSHDVNPRVPVYSVAEGHPMTCKIDASWRATRPAMLARSQARHVATAHRCTACLPPPPPSHVHVATATTPNGAFAHRAPLTLL